MSRILGSVAAAVFIASLALTGCTDAPGDASIDPVGTWGDTSDTTEPSLTLEEDGKLSGTDGCNQLSGSWRVESEDEIYFDSVAATLKECPDMDTWLDKLSQATVSGDTMTITGSDGSEIGQLERTSGDG